MESRQSNDPDHGVEDMINLSVLDESTILQNLVVRYGREHIYTFTGSILVSVNPYKMFNIYGLDMVKKYEGQPLGSLPPHLFAIGSVSYSRMLKEKENQVIIISGESGAGKTEATKLVMQYLAAVNKSGNNLITEQILEANPLLESFGNAKTIRNDNSSRFGKYIEVFFKTGSIVGARTLEYLLEKSRIVTQAQDERNYHVFYEMLSGMSQETKNKYGLQSASKYFYLNQGGSHELMGRDDVENYRILMGAFDVLNFPRNEQETIMKILSSVLHLGNIYFKPIQHDNGPDTVVLGSDAELKWISHLLQLSDDWLKQALTTKVTETRGDRVLTPYNMDQALDTRDAIAKALYSRLFTWLVERVNLIICRSEREKTSSLAVLDIFGFEDFHHNSFEQLCINYANETLQFFFNQHIFRLEQKEYTKENIDWSNIEFRDNQPVIDLLASKPAGILTILDDECSFPKASDQSFLEKCHFHHASNTLYDKPRMSVPEFHVYHFAGKIKYNVDHFLEKNKDTLRSDVVELLCESKNTMIAQMFKEMRDRLITKTLSKTTGRYVTLKPRTPTVAAGFTESLLSLIDTMSKCHPYFVRCLKPNNHKAPMQFERTVVLEQLRYTGMLETIKIRKMGFPIRVKFPVFIDRYRYLLLGQNIHNNLLPNNVCKMILSTQKTYGQDLYRIGATKVFMKESFEQTLDEEAKKVQYEAVLKIQTCIRAYISRRKFLRVHKSSVKIQAAIHTWLERKKFLAIRNGIIRAQAQLRMRRQRKKYLQKREEIRQKLEKERLARKRQEEQEQMEREEKLKRAKALEAIANLEIPAELAYVYSKLDDWQCVHQDRHVTHVKKTVAHMDQKYKLPEDINSHAFSKYTNIYFKNPNEFGMQLMPIKNSLTQLSGEDNKKALAVFKVILRFMNDANLSVRREKTMCDFIVQMGLEQESLRDEIYCQVANQCWNNQNPSAIERGWSLMGACLSAFPPSNRIFKYILKFVSDVGFNGFKVTCQHKALQCANIEPQLSRIYPPCLLEWRAIQQHTNMALEARLPDGSKVFAPVESWTSGELFSSHLMQSRGLRENSHGWTVALQEDTDQYELMGYDYVLDLISEMEIAPGFPVCKSYFLVSSDRTQEPLATRRNMYRNLPHSVERDRFMFLQGRLPSPLKVETSKLENRTLINKPMEEEGDGIELSMTSALNRRPTEIMVDGLSNNKLNFRYTKRKAPGPPGSTNGHLNGLANGDAPHIFDDDRDINLIKRKELGLAESRLNSRYGGNAFSNGSPRTFDDDLNSNSKLNARYVKSKMFGGRKSAVDKIRKREARERALERESASSELSNGTTGHDSDWSHWVEDVFNNALNEHVDALSDARSMENRIKGGGKGVPGPGIQPAPVPPLNLNLMSSANGLPMSMPLNSAMTSPAVQAGTGDPFAQLQQQMAAQQLAQQQAMMQNYLQQLMQAQAQAQAQAQVQAQAQAQAQQQMQAQAQARQQQALMQQILQLQQQQQQQQGTANMVAGFGTSQAPTLLSPSSSMNSVGVSPFQTPREPVVNGTAMTGFPTGMSVQTQETSSGVPKKVYKIKTQFEGRTEHKSFQPEENGQTFDNSGANHLHLVDQKTESESHKTRMVNQGVLPPPPPPPSFQDNNLVSPRMAVKPPAPPPPPPVMQSTDSFDRENGTFTFTDKKGRARTVRIGRVVWPPPVAHEAKQNREVGRLEIDENVAKTINDQHGAKKLNKKPVAPPPEKKEMKRTKSLAESVHLATLQVLEQKLGKKETDRIPPPKPPTPEPLPPPLPQLPPPPQSKESTQSLEVVERKVLPPKEKIIIDYSTLEKVTTKLYPQGKDNYMTYSGVPWDINVRKEVFYPRERLENPNALHMIFCQVVEDVYNNGCIRISKEDRIKMRGMLEGYGINHNNFRTGSFSSQVKKIIVDTAKEWPCYFCRLFPVAGQDQYSHVRFIGINHTGVRYITRERSLIEDALHVQEHIKFEDIIDVVMPTNDTIQINTKNRSVVFYTNRARQLKNMIDSFLHESDKGNKYVVAVKDYITRESTLLSFKRGDIIKMVDAEIPLEDNWLYGSLNGVLGYFPAEYIRPLQRHEVERSAGNGMKAQITETVIQRIIRPPSRNGEMDNRSETSQGTVVPDGKFSMMEYALMNFRESKDNFRHEGNRHFRAGGGDWSWKEQADMVKWTRSPIQASLLRLISSDLNKLALECFLCIMKFMGDYPMAPNQTEYDCAFKILKTCHKFPELRDEIYCQLCKQTTNNRSMKPRSCIMGWRLLSIVACYCDCSETMRPYLFKYLETTASDTARSYSGAAAICLQNLRKTFKYGGRKNVPLKEEIFALCEGRVSKRFSFIYSGSERGGMLQVKPSMVVKDAIEDICNRLDIFDPVEMEEYTLFLRTKEHGQNHFVRLRSEEYILDITAELVRKNAEYNLVFQRTVWYFPFRETDNMIYNELMFFQCLPDYLEGLLVSTTNGRLNRMEEGDIPFLGALLFKAFDRVGAPTIKDLTYLLPKNLTNLNISSQQWVNRINDHMAQAQRLGAINCKAKFVSVLSQWPLFGSIFFMVKNAPTQPIIMGTCILAVNRNGIQFLKENSHESVLQYQFSEIMSTRRYRSDSNQNYLDMKLGNLMVQKIVRVETDQGSDISNLIGQYMQVINRHRKRPLERSAIAQN